MTTTVAPAVMSEFVREEQVFTSFDGTQLFYRAWLPRERPISKALLLFHRGHEHSGRWEEFVADLNPDPDMAVFAWDARGHGRSQGERGHAPSFAALTRDIDCFVRHLTEQHGIGVEEMAVLAHSVGAVAAAAWVHDYAPPIRAMVLAVPAFSVKLYIPFAMPALRIWNRVKPGGHVKSYVRPQMLTHDPAAADAYADDPLLFWQIAINVLIDMKDTADRLVADAAAITVPTQILCAGNDWVVNNRPQEQFFQGLSSPHKQFIHYDGFGHAIFHEIDRQRPIADVRRFLTEAFATIPNRSHLRDADQTGPTKEEFDRLRRPLPMLSPKRWNFAAQKLVIKSIARLSQGVRIGWEHGFDSGESLDHVYANRATGTTPFGRLIDRIYLNAVGWRGIRQRRVDMVEMLQCAIARVRASGAQPHIVDIAAGPGRYVLEVMRSDGGADLTATLRDRSPTAQALGRQLAAEWGISRVTFTPGDAFDPDDLARLSPRPHIAIVSGLYELFPGNAPIRASLRGLASALPAGGYLIYTGQPWHPQLEMIARVLPNRDGAPWIMRRRTQAELDELVREAGFRKVEQRIDPAGIFTVSLAQKIDSPASD